MGDEVEDIKIRFIAAFTGIDKELEKRQQQYSLEASRIGYARRVLIDTENKWLSLSESSEMPHSTLSALTSVLTLGQEISEINAKGNVGGENRPIYSGILFLASATGSIVESPPSLQEVTHGYDVLFAPMRNDEEYAAKLSAMNEPLGRTYRAINEVLFGTTSDPIRGSLFLMRQAHDQMFALLAPDDEIRESPYWTVKEGTKPNQVYRSERIAFALATRVRDPSRVRTLSASAEHMLEVYEELNAAHSRDALDDARCRSAIQAMKTLIEDWTDAVS